MSYDFKNIEKKWQKYWDEHHTFEVTEDNNFPEDKRLYILDMFPYPSGEGLHVGHPEGYIATDILTHYYKMKGYNILNPMGWDAFGLPAENYAIKTKTHPAITTAKNIGVFKKQIKSLGLAYDWSREINTTDPDYYKWTQWIFLKLFEKGLAYKKEAPINFCPSCLTGIANEEVKEGKCERCGTVVIRKNLPQWLLKITVYAERLLSDLELLDWPEDIKTMQQNWIGKSEGAYINFDIENFNDRIEVFTTRPDTIYGVTYMVLAPEHPLVDKITTSKQKKEIENYKHYTSTKSELERTSLIKDKTGAFTGSYVIHPLTKKKIPIWISDYILISYGTGAIMAVPGHDQRDLEFAQKYNLDIVQVVSPQKGVIFEKSNEAFIEEGFAVNSGKYDGLTTGEFIREIIKYFEENKIGKLGITYKLRDWIFSRQRYWGEPIPIVECKNCGHVPIPESDLPLKLPEVTSFSPTETGESPLANAKEWVKTTCPKCGGPALRETNTMPNWAGSCWYYLRYIDPKNKTSLCAMEKQKYWLPVDIYVGGKEHAVLHLLYARFWHKFLYDIGCVSTTEPFIKLRNQGLILGEDNQKMSKSRGNVVNPDDIVSEFGADTFRIYEMFMGPLEVSKPWNTNSIKGMRRFLERIFTLFTQTKIVKSSVIDDKLERLMHKSIQKVSADIESISSFNTAISQMMIFLNELENYEEIPEIVAINFIKLIAPFAPHIAEELWSILMSKNSIFNEPWPDWNDDKLQQKEVTIAVQVNGKLRGQVNVTTETSEKEIIEIAKSNEKIKKYISDRQIIKTIYVPKKILNILIGG
ncbi:MAG: leucine--tRNA ligase [Elusimicrobia bacterium]|nr:leucine--tRNA ligase [Elusimicrobiota bacterium]